jgi:hypothetical protein
MIHAIHTYFIRRISFVILLVVCIGFDLSAQEADSVRRVLQRSELKPDTIIRPSVLPERDLTRSVETGDVIQDTTDLMAEQREDLKEGHSPRKAVVLALALPGAGQAYNGKYWKMPIVYGALGGTGYLIYYNIDVYRQYIDLYDTDPNTFERYVKNARRNVELSMITLVAVYALQVVDAYVDANLYYWDVSPDLSVRVAPFLEPSYVPGNLPRASYGLRVGFKF